MAYLPFQNVSHLRVIREGFLSKITKAFGAQDIHVGDPAFDQAYLIASDTPQFVPHIHAAPMATSVEQRGSATDLTAARGRETERRGRCRVARKDRSPGPPTDPYVPN